MGAMTTEKQPRATAHEGVMAVTSDGGSVIFDAILTPHRSLSQRGFVILMSVICAVSFTAGLAFLLMGAWPVVGLLGLDALMIYIAFKINFRSARLYETVTVTPDELLVERVSPRGDAQRWRFQPAWLQVLMDDPPRHESQVMLRSHGRKLVVGSFLTPEERRDFANALKQALAKAQAPQMG